MNHFTKGLIVCACLCLSGIASADFLPASDDMMRIGADARPVGMGKAYCAMGDDGSSMFMNPAGLTQAGDAQFTSLFTSLMDGDMPYSVISASKKAFGLTIGIGAISASSGLIPSPSAEGIGYFDYSDRIIFFSLAKDLSRKKEHRISAGINIKYFTKGFSGSHNNSASAVDMDLGVKYSYQDKLFLGIDLIDFLPSRMAWTSGAVEDLPFIIKLGAGTKINKAIKLAVDADIYTGRSRPCALHAGVEYTVSENLFIRAGLDQSPSAADGLSTNPTAGVGLLMNGLSFDYAYHPFSDGYSSAAHFFSVSYTVPDKSPDRLHVVNTVEAVKLLPVEVATVEAMKASTPEAAPQPTKPVSTLMIPTKESMAIASDKPVVEKAKQNVKKQKSLATPKKALPEKAKIKHKTAAKPALNSKIIAKEKKPVKAIKKKKVIGKKLKKQKPVPHLKKMAKRLPVISKKITIKSKILVIPDEMNEAPLKMPK